MDANEFRTLRNDADHNVISQAVHLSNGIENVKSLYGRLVKENPNNVEPNIKIAIDRLDELMAEITVVTGDLNRAFWSSASSMISTNPIISEESALNILNRVVEKTAVLDDIKFDLYNCSNVMETYYKQLRLKVNLESQFEKDFKSVYESVRDAMVAESKDGTYPPVEFAQAVMKQMNVLYEGVEVIPVIPEVDFPDGLTLIEENAAKAVADDPEFYANVKNTDPEFYAALIEEGSVYRKYLIPNGESSEPVIEFFGTAYSGE